ncbi:N-acetylmuramidase domain-containing protein [Bacteroides cutis]|uniref:N-acetylmuramidase domain-containing protein n=1 Tax=Bacteroides cutis TaxID=2024197 RepID=UPI001FEC7142|nr:N-acetylmuramidase domain-containing protein [Bacteroides cutis]
MESFVFVMCESEFKQLILFTRFIKQTDMLSALQCKNWTEFANAIIVRFTLRTNN